MATLNDLADFAIALDAQLPNLPSDLGKQITMAIIDELATVTPVDTGAALSNWQVTLDAPATEEIPTYVPSEAGVWHGHIWNHRVNPSITRGANKPLVLDNAALALGDKQPGQDIYITNIVGTDKEPESYILELDKARSQQFMTGDFVGQAQLRVDQFLETAKLIVR